MVTGSWGHYTHPRIHPLVSEAAKCAIRGAQLEAGSWGVTWKGLSPSPAPPLTLCPDHHDMSSIPSTMILPHSTSALELAGHGL